MLICSTVVGLTLIRHEAVRLDPSLVVAETVASPSACAVNRPLLSTETIDGLDDSHLSVLSVVVAGVKRAVNWMVPETFRNAVVLLRVIASANVGITVMDTLASFDPTFAIISAVPSLFAVTSPLASTEAILSSEEDQIMLFSVVVVGRTVASSCMVSPTFRLA